jgi:hypothetical protein
MGQLTNFRSSGVQSAKAPSESTFDQISTRKGATSDNLQSSELIAGQVSLLGSSGNTAIAPHILYGARSQ